MSGMEWLFLKGLGFGLLLAAPVGPIGVLAVRRSLADGFLPGVTGGLGTATADAFYAAVAAFGLTAVSAFLVAQQDAMRLLGGAFLIWLGFAAFRRGAVQAVAAERRMGAGLVGIYLSTFALTIANPATILTFLALFAGLGIVQASGGASAGGILVTGVFLGSLLWWVFLCGVVSLVRARVTPEAMIWINRISGIILAGFGAAALFHLL